MGNLRSELKGEIAEVKGEMGNLRSDLKGEIAEVKGEMGNLRSELKGEIAGLRGEVAELRGEIAGVKVAQGDLEVHIERVDGNIARLEAKMVRWMAGSVIALVSSLVACTGLAFTAARMIR
jgi:hypothetical protein